MGRRNNSEVYPAKIKSLPLSPAMQPASTGTAVWKYEVCIADMRLEEKQ